jgi:hypothetical protein
LVAGEHVPDRFGESAGEVDLGDLGAALFADAGFGALVAVALDRGGAGVGGSFDERPAQVAASLLGERASAVGLAGLVDARTEAGIAGELDYANEVEDVLRKVPEQRRQISELEDRQHATRSKLTK